jgi:glyoxalase family protein
MELEGLHHVTCITGDAPGNVDFYTRVLGLRLVAKTVNQDDTSVYHLFYADEVGSPGSDITFFEYPGSPPGRAGAGMVHRVVWRVGSAASLAFWADRLAAEGIATRELDGGLVFADPEGLGHELVVSESTDEPLMGVHPAIPAEHALLGFDGVRAFTGRRDSSVAVLEQVLGGTEVAPNTYEVRGTRRGATIRFDDAPDARPLQGAGTVHHIAWFSTVEDHRAWLERVEGVGIRTSGMVDRHYFRSIYFREPSGILYEIADDGPGFTRDVPLEELGTKVILPPWLEPRRAELEALLTPLPPDDLRR